MVLLIPVLFKKDQCVFYWSRDSVEFLAWEYLVIDFLASATFYTMGDLDPWAEADVLESLQP